MDDLGSDITIGHSKKIMDEAQRELDRRAKRKKKKKVIKKMGGGSLKNIPAGNKGLPNLPTATRNKMGFKKAGGIVKNRNMGGVIGGGLGSQDVVSYLYDYKS